jgi:HEAT repeat protein
VAAACAALCWVLAASAPWAAEEDAPRPAAALKGELASGDLKTRRDAAYWLHVLGPEAREAVPELVRALDDRDRQVWFYAVSALARIGPAASEAVPALIAQLEDGGEAQRSYRAAYALGMIGEPALPALGEALRGDSRRRRLGAAKALSWMGAAAAPLLPDLDRLLREGADEEIAAAAEALSGMGEAAVPTLTAALASGGPRVRGGAAPALRRAAAAGPSAAARAAIREGLGKALGDSEAEVRVAAVLGLSSLEGDAGELVPLLTARLEDPDAEVKKAAEVALFNLPAEATVAALIDVLSVGSAAAVEGAASALGRIGARARAAIPSLVEALARAEELDERSPLPEAIARFGLEAAGPMVDALAGAEVTPAGARGLAQGLAAVGPDAVPLLAGALRHEAAPVRSGAAAALGGIGAASASAVEPLSRALGDPDPAVRASAARALGRIGEASRPAAPALSAVLDDPASAVRAGAVFALARIGLAPGDLVPALVRALEDADPGVRRDAAGSLAALGAAAAPAAAALAARLEDADSGVRAGAASALAGLEEGAAGAVGALTRAAGDPDPAVRLAAVQALGRVGTRAVSAAPALAALLEETLGAEDHGALAAALVSALADMGPAAGTAVPALLEALERGGAELREASVEALGSLVRDPKMLVPALVRIVKDDESSSVRRAAVSALGDVGPEAEDAIPVLLSLLDREYERRGAYDAVRRIGPRSVDLLLELLEHPQRFVRALACERLGELGADARRALPRLEELKRDDRDDRVRERAAEAIRRLRA